MKNIIKALPLLLLVSCKKDTKQTTPPPVEPTCDCYQRHENLSSNLGQFSWVLDYETSPATDFCSKDDSVWNYNANGAHRWRWICQ